MGEVFNQTKQRPRATECRSNQVTSDVKTHPAQGCVHICCTKTEHTGAHVGAEPSVWRNVQLHNRMRQQVAYHGSFSTGQKQANGG